MSQEKQFLGLDLKDWFTHHPPITTERKAAHNLANQFALSAAENIKNFDALESHIRALIAIIDESETRLTSWANRIRDKLYQNLRNEGPEFQAMMFIQQLKMLAHQAITVDELHKLKESQVKVDTVSEAA